jgi:hypothetical protein
VRAFVYTVMGPRSLVFPLAPDSNPECYFRNVMWPLAMTGRPVEVIVEAVVPVMSVHKVKA